MKANTTKKRILVFIDWYLPGYKAGGPVRSMANMTAHLSDTLDFYIVTRNSEYGEVAPYEGIQPDRWIDLAPGVKVWYCSAETPSVGLWKRLIKESRCEVVYINGIYSPLFSLLPLLAAKLLKFKRVIVAPRGMLANSAINVKQGKKKLFLGISRLLPIYNKVVWHVTNTQEGEQVKARFGNEAKLVVANNLARKTEAAFEALSKEKGQLRVCIPARIAPEKNTLFAIECLQHVGTEIALQLDLYGQIYNQDYWRDCQALIQQLPAHIQVAHKGIVDAEMIPDLLKDYHAVFLPSRGENFGHVILESFMAGRPVVISDQTPWRNLTEKLAGWDLPLADQAAFAETLTRLADMAQDEYDKLCRGARAIGAESSGDVALLDTYKTMFTGNNEK